MTTVTSNSEHVQDEMRGPQSHLLDHMISIRITQVIFDMISSVSKVRGSSQSIIVKDSFPSSLALVITADIESVFDLVQRRPNSKLRPLKFLLNWSSSSKKNGSQKNSFVDLDRCDVLVKSNRVVNDVRKSVVCSSRIVTATTNCVVSGRRGNSVCVVAGVIVVFENRRSHRGFRKQTVSVNSEHILFSVDCL